MHLLHAVVTHSLHRHSLYTPLVISAIIITAAAAAGGDDDEDGDARRNDAN